MRREGATHEVLAAVRPVFVALVVCALVAGLVQIIASIHLGLQHVDALTQAAQEGPRIYLIAIAAVTIGVVALWVLRKRPLIAAVAFLVWQISVLWPLASRM